MPDSGFFEPLTYRAIKNHYALPLRSVYNEDFQFQSQFYGRDYAPHTFLAVLSRGNEEETVKRCIGS